MSKVAGEQEDDSIVISLRLDPALAEAFKVEAARRNVRLKALFAEMWEGYVERRRVSAR